MPIFSPYYILLLVVDGLRNNAYFFPGSRELYISMHLITAGQTAILYGVTTQHQFRQKKEKEKMAACKYGNSTRPHVNGSTTYASCLKRARKIYLV